MLRRQQKTVKAEHAGDTKQINAKRRRVVTPKDVHHHSPDDNEALEDKVSETVSISCSAQPIVEESGVKFNFFMRY